MKGLIIKDFINLKQQVKPMLLLLVFYFVFGIATKNSSMFSSLLIIYSAVLPLTIFSYDEKAKWSRYALTMPVSRKELVVSKYLVYLIINLTLSIVSMILTFATGTLLLESLSMVFLIACIGWLYIAISYPVIFHFGVEKARIITMLFMVVAMIGFTAGGEFIMSLGTSISSIILYIAVPVISIIMIAASILISCRVMTKKEF